MNKNNNRNLLSGHQTFVNDVLVKKNEEDEKKYTGTLKSTAAE